MAKRQQQPEPEMKIVKIGHKSGTTHVNGVINMNGDTITRELVSDTPPNPEFFKSLDTLGAYMITLMGLPADFKDNQKCLWVSVGHEEDDRLNAIITLSVKLDKFNAPMTINTPIMREKLAGSPGKGFMTEKMLDLVKAVIKEADLYAKGERAQQELIKEGTGEEE